MPQKKIDNSTISTGHKFLIIHTKYNLEALDQEK